MERSLADLAKQYNEGKDVGQGQFTQSLASLAAGLRHMFATPGDVAAGKYAVKPEVPGQWSEADEFRQQHAQGQLADWGASTAMGMVGGARLPGGAPSGVLGSSGSKLTQPEGIRAYHGSPHDFDRFDLSKIGTGEGAQAYGHGLYFAEKEGTARSYRDALAKPGMARADEEALAAIAPQWDRITAQLRAAREKSGGRITDETSALQNHLDALNDHAISDTLSRKPHLEKGRMYEVNINAKPEQFLDWDKPLSAQSSNVRDIAGGERSIAYGELRDQFLKPMHEVIKDKDFARFVKADDFYNTGGVNMDAVREALKKDPGTLARIEDLQRQFEGRKELRGSDAYHVLARAHETETGGLTGASHSVEASEALRDRGIPGIRYLDQGSRTAGTGSSNYVMFDPSLIEIMRKYGLAGLTAGGAGAAAAGSSSNANAMSLRDLAKEYVP